MDGRCFRTGEVGAAAVDEASPGAGAAASVEVEVPLEEGLGIAPKLIEGALGMASEM
jgi:hypothetical protein